MRLMLKLYGTEIAEVPDKPTAASARFWASQFHEFEDRSADLHGGLQRAREAVGQDA